MAENNDQRANDLVGKRLVYRYDNGWLYELYVKNDETIDYRIHTGIVGGRWVRDQRVDLVCWTEATYKISWTEPTGTSVSLLIDPQKRKLHGTIFFPRWVEEHPSKTICFQNDHLAEMKRLRDIGPTYPLYVVAEFATIHAIEAVGANDEDAVRISPSELGSPWYARLGIDQPDTRSASE